MTAVWHPLRTTLFGFVLGIGLLVAGAAGLAAADPGDSGVSTGSSSTVSRSDRDSTDASGGSGVRAHASDRAAQQAAGAEEQEGAGAAPRRPTVRPTQANPPRTNTRPTVVRPVAVQPAEPVEPTPVTPQRTEEPAPTPVVYGRPAENVQFWAARDWDTHNLNTVTMVLRQLTGRMIDPQEVIDQAERTGSSYRDNRTIYLGANANDTVWREDALELLADAGVEVTSRKYPNSQRQLALENLEKALQDPQKAVLVNIDGPAVGWNRPTDHTVVVLGVDHTNGLVYLNDAALPVGGRGRTMPLDRFLAVWNSNYRTITAQLTSPRSAQAAVAA